jgi:Fur family iron response transcriptional regulator
MARPSKRIPVTDARLVAHGVRPTPQRLAVARVLLDRPQHLSADDILGRLRERGLAASKATVYNTLRLFVAKGLVREVVVDPDRVFFDSTSEPHHHFWHEDTHELADIPDSAVRLAGLPELPKGTVQTGVDVVVRVRKAR